MTYFRTSFFLQNIICCASASTCIFIYSWLILPLLIVFRSIIFRICASFSRKEITWLLHLFQVDMNMPDRMKLIWFAFVLDLPVVSMARSKKVLTPHDHQHRPTLNRTQHEDRSSPYVLIEMVSRTCWSKRRNVSEKLSSMACALLIHKSFFNWRF